MSSEGDSVKVLYHLSRTIEDQSLDLKEMQKDMHQIKIDIAVMKQARGYPENSSIKKLDRMKDSAAGGGIGAIIVAVIIGVVEYFKKS